MGRAPRLQLPKETLPWLGVTRTAVIPSVHVRKPGPIAPGRLAVRTAQPAWGPGAHLSRLGRRAEKVNRETTAEPWRDRLGWSPRSALSSGYLLAPRRSLRVVVRAADIHLKREHIVLIGANRSTGITVPPKAALALDDHMSPPAKQSPNMDRSCRSRVAPNATKEHDSNAQVPPALPQTAARAPTNRMAKGLWLCRLVAAPDYHPLMGEERVVDAEIRRGQVPETALDDRLVACPCLVEEAICQIRTRRK